MTKETSLDVWPGDWEGKEPGQGQFQEGRPFFLIMARVPYLLQSKMLHMQEGSSIQ